MTMNRIRRALLASDEGSALVAAVSVAIIGMMLTAVVVAQAVIVTNDAGRDRARTVQVHGAEGAVDHLYGVLETQTPCTWPASGTKLVSSAVNETVVSATITYYDDANNAIACADGVLAATPASAVITATAGSGELAGDGIDPTRTVQAKVLLDPLTEPGAGAAIFSSYAIGTITNNFTLSDDEPDSDADVWIDGGDVDCNSNVSIKGRLFVADGRLAMSNNCTVEKDVRVKGNLTMHQGRIQGDGYVYSGNATMNGTQARVDGNLTASGSISNSTGGGMTGIVGGTVTPGWAPPSQITKVPLPEVTYAPGDWAGYSTATSFAQWLKGEAENNGAQPWVPFRSGDPCGTQISRPNWSMNGPVRSPNGKTIIDARACTNGFRIQDATLRLRGDLVIFARSFNITNTVNVVSADGNPYTLWLIVPDTNPNGVAECSGTAGKIEVNSTVNFGGPTVNTFLYSPCDVSVSNNVSLHGQVYGKSVKLQNNLNVTFRGVGIPGVDLFPEMPVAGAGMEVQVVYKREIGSTGP